MQSDDTLREFFIYSRSRKKLALGFCIGVPALAWGLMYFSEPTWASHVTLVVPPELSAAAAPIVQNPAVNALASMAASEAVLKGPADRRKMLAADLRDMVTVTPSPDTLTIDIACRQKTQKASLALAGEILESLIEVNKGLDFNIGQLQSANLESAVKEREKSLEKAENAIRDFMLKSQTAPDPSDTRAGGQFRAELMKVINDIRDTQKKLDIAKQQAATSASADLTLPLSIPNSEKWRDKIVQLEHDLRVLKTDLGPSAPQVVQKQLELDEARKTRAGETKRYLESVNDSIAPEVADLAAQLELLRFRESYLQKMSDIGPNESLTMKRLVRELNVQSQILQNVRVQYEQAQIKTEVANVRFAVLDKPFLEIPAVNKHPVRSIGYGVIVGILFTVIANLIGFVRKTPSEDLKN